VLHLEILSAHLEARGINDNFRDLEVERFTAETMSSGVYNSPSIMLNFWTVIKACWTSRTRNSDTMDRDARLC